MPSNELEGGRVSEQELERQAKHCLVPWAIDKFMCLWTAVELLSDDMRFRVDTPYKPDCGHGIHECPECGE